MPHDEPDTFTYYVGRVDGEGRTDTVWKTTRESRWSHVEVFTEAIDNGTVAEVGPYFVFCPTDYAINGQRFHTYKAGLHFTKG